MARSGPCRGSACDAAHASSSRSSLQGNRPKSALFIPVDPLSAHFPSRTADTGAKHLEAEAPPRKILIADKRPLLISVLFMSFRRPTSTPEHWLTAADLQVHSTQRP